MAASTLPGCSDASEHEAHGGAGRENTPGGAPATAEPGAGHGGSAISRGGVESGGVPGGGLGGVAEAAGASAGNPAGAGGRGSNAAGTGGLAAGGHVASGGAAGASLAAGRAGAPGEAAGGRAGRAGAGAGGSSGGPPACTSNQIAACTQGTSVECHLGGKPGDYLVTIELGGSAAGDQYVEAESYRRMLGETVTAADQTRRFSFFVNVREPEGQPIQDVPAGTPGLDLYLRGTAPELTAICFEAQKPAPKLWIAGDSTVCDQDGTDYAGWGQHLPQFFLPPVAIANLADSGESSGSFLASSKLWGAIKSGWSAGDYVLIQLGHNDKDVTAATFESNMKTMVTQAVTAGVKPILVTPTSRVGYALADEHVNSTGANLPQIIRALGQSENVPVIDLTVTTWNWLQTVDYTKYFALGTDHTHTNPAGAEIIAGFVRDAIVKQGLPLATYVR